MKLTAQKWRPFCSTLLMQEAENVLEIMSRIGLIFRLDGDNAGTVVCVSKSIYSPQAMVMPTSSFWKLPIPLMLT